MMMPGLGTSSEGIATCAALECQLSAEERARINTNRRIAYVLQLGLGGALVLGVLWGVFKK